MTLEGNILKTTMWGPYESDIIQEVQGKDMTVVGNRNIINCISDVIMTTGDLFYFIALLYVDVFFS